MEYFYIFFLSYIAGSIPFGLLITKILGFEDIRKIGSGNIGATNVLRTGNKKIAILVLILDLLKCYLPTLFFLNSFNDNIGTICGLFAIIGHIFPLWIKFKGGKGVACFYGLLLAINPIILIISLAIWALVVFITRFSSLGSIISVIITFFLFLIYEDDINIVIPLTIIILIIFKHKENILRLITNKENKIKI